SYLHGVLIPSRRGKLPPSPVPAAGGHRPRVPGPPHLPPARGISPPPPPLAPLDPLPRRCHPPRPRASRRSRAPTHPRPDLARAGRIDLLVTQNVDGLHERSGFPPERLVNIHGTDSAVECMACRRRAPRAVAQAVWEAGMAVPRCDCGGPWKPATISFGQQLVAVDLERALDAAAACDLFVAAGTSLVVGPANQMFPVARQAGARTASVTASATPYDAAAD